jgi:ribonuclease J
MAREGKWVMVDLGLTFADPNIPASTLILPDLDFIERQRSTTCSASC